MSFSSTYSKLFLVASIGLAIASCLIPALTEVKDITGNRSTYKNEQFSLENISPETLATFRREKRGFRKYTNFMASYSCQQDAEATPKIFKLKDSYSYLAPGFNQFDIEFYNNDIPSDSIIGINYLGLINIRFQYMDYTRRFARKIMELKVIGGHPSDLINAKTDSNYEFSSQYQLESLVLNQSYSFKTKQVIPASQIFANLPGDAIMVETETKDDGIVSSKDTRYYIFDYGVSIQVSHQTANYKRICTVQSIEIH